MSAADDDPSSKALNPTFVKGLDQLRINLERLAAAVAAGQLAPNDVSATLAQSVDDVHGLLTDLAKLPDTTVNAASVRREAAALILEVLTPRERVVTEAVLTHGTTALAAHAIGMSEATLGHHRSNILRKLKVNNFAQVARMIANADQIAG